MTGYVVFQQMYDNNYSPMKVFLKLEDAKIYIAENRIKNPTTRYHYDTIEVVS